MMRKVVPGLLICGMGIGCARMQPMDTTLFVAPTLHGTSDAAPASVAADIQPAPSTGETAKNASILPPADSRPFDTLKPLDDPSPPPTTMPSDPSVTQTAPAQAALLASYTQTPGQGVYMTLGGVLAQVNNTPIYTSQVLGPLSKEFAAKSKEMDPASFREFAEQEIGRQLVELIRGEEYFATAYHALSAEDRQLAEGLVAQVRHEKVVAAGGSESIARQRALDEGEEFDEGLRQEYRKVVNEIYQHRRIDPLVQVTADEMRTFYRLNFSKLYSEKDRAQFRVLAIAPENCGGMKPAMEKITALRDRAVHGEDFSKLASTENDDEFLKGRGGNPCDDGGWMERNTYRIDEVEAAVWNIQPGEITPVIEADHALYIAKLDAKRVGVTKSFDDQLVQEDIYARLRQQQLGDLWRKSKDDSIDDEVATKPEEIDRRVQVALDVAMQKYEQTR